MAKNQKRNIAPESLAPLLEVPGVRFFSLQKAGPRAPDSFELIDWMDDCRDFADTAALIANLDLVISVDTAVAHLAGALGKPVWLLNRFSSCWRWLREREDSPWYPESFRAFRQREIGRWEEVVERVREALERCVRAAEEEADGSGER
jgi:ADP-heptose:LPS heptosyltransferase